MLDRVMKFTMVHMFIIGVVALIIGGAGTAGLMYREGLLVRVGGGNEGFEGSPACGLCGRPRPCGCASKPNCDSCGMSRPCGCASKPNCPPVAPCPRVMEPDLSKYILKSQVPPPSQAVMPDLSNYMMKTECPPVPDLSKYVLKSSIPKPQPVIIDNSSCKNDAGECPPCPRPRCPIVKCPPPTKCPTPAPCPRAVCPPSVVKCKAEESSSSTVRPFLAPLNMSGFGMA